MFRVAILVFVLTALPASAKWKWYEWPTRNVTFYTFGNPVQAKLGTWSVKIRSITIEHSESHIALIVRVPNVNTKLEEETAQMHEDCRTFFTNIMPYWDGAYDSIQQLWKHYEADKKQLPIEHNQYTITYTSNEKTRFVRITPRKDFSFGKRRNEVSRRLALP